MKRLLGTALLFLICVAHASAATITVFEKRQFSFPVPDGWKSEESRAESGLQTVVIDDPNGSVKLAFTFIPDAEKRFSTKEQLSGLMGDALADLLAGAVEKQLTFTVVDAPGGFEAHSFFTDKKFDGMKVLPKGEWRHVTAGVRTFGGTFIFFTLLSNDADSAARTKALAVVTKELREVH
jgi:hypothetical protein